VSIRRGLQPGGPGKTHDMVKTEPRSPEKPSNPDRSGFFRTNSLSLVCFGLAAIFIVGLLFTGFRDHNDDQRAHGEPEM
jgi:hypothetical protein